MVQDPDHIRGVRLEPVARLGFVRISPASQIQTDEGTRPFEVARQGVERAVLGGDAVQAEYGVRALSGAPDRQLDLPRYPVCGPEALLHGGHYTALTMDYFENITDVIGNTPLMR